MVSTLLLIVIYISFISLGLPDSLLGASWPMMHLSLGFDVSNLGYISFTICIGTVISSLLYSKLSSRFRTEKITTVSVMMTALSLFFFAFAANTYTIFPIALLLGLGAGSVDAGLNYYVALHYKARHMSWLHAFWGLGTTIGPFLLSFLLSRGYGWHEGYRVLGTMQLIVCIMLFATLPLWKIAGKADNAEQSSSLPENNSFCRKAVIPAIIGFFGYCSMENTAMIWSATFLVETRGFSESLAAISAGVLFWGMTAGRLFSGIVSDRLGDRKMLLIGETASLIAILLIAFMPARLSVIALFLLGFGFGPIYPAISPFSMEKLRSETACTVVILPAIRFRRFPANPPAV